VPGVGHLPIRKKEFYRWGPLYIGQSAVTEEELEGYRMWQKANGEYFDSPLSISNSHPR